MTTRVSQRQRDLVDVVAAASGASASIGGVPITVRGRSDVVLVTFTP